MTSPLFELTMARLREFVREPEALFWAFVFPIIMSVALALAFPNTRRTVTIGIRPGNGAPEAQRILADVPGLALKEIPPDGEARAIREGEIDLVLVPTSPPTYRYDGNRDESRLARLTVDQALQRAAGRRDPMTARDETLDVPGSRYVDWLVPGIVGMGIMSTGMWGIAFSIVQTRMRKLLKQLVASPMRRRDYLVAQVLARLIFLLPEVAVPLAFGALVLGVPIRGTPWAIAAVSFVGALAFGGMALLAASRAKTFEAISGILNLSMLPMWVLGGVFFSASRFPSSLQPVIQVLPLTALNNALRAVILEGSSMNAIRGELSLMAAWGLIPFAIALRVFRWR